MVLGIIPSTLIAVASLPLALNLQSSPLSTPQTGFPMVVEATQSPSRVVRENDTLSIIAQEYYGDSAYWTTIWNDNPDIEDPNLIEPGLQLNLREQKPAGPEELRRDLALKRNQPVNTNILVYQSVNSNANIEDQVQAQPASSYVSGPLNEAQINFLGTCEAGMDPMKNTGNGYYGAFQFSYGTWKSMGTAYERADLAPLDVQIDAVQRLVQRSSIFTQFPACSRKMQSIGLI
ncbi:MAG: transglycosylase family protein [Candidatus Levybacteria bacterium]|nr:transglycosylase family protein [Candidatus Levybacteria bacterium]